MRRHWIDGKDSVGKRSAITVMDPATGDVLDSVARGTSGDAEGAVAAARAAFPAWRFVPGVEKAAMLHEVARRMRERHHQLATTIASMYSRTVLLSIIQVVFNCFTVSAT